MKHVLSRVRVFFFLCFVAFPVHSQGQPDPPGSLSATPGDGQVSLRWSIPADNGSPITHYEYRQRIDEDNAPWQPDWTTVPDSSAQTTSYTIAGLTNGTTYRFRVRAVNAVGASATARTKATPAGPPDPPGSLSATSGDGQVSLSWSIPADNGSPITHYEYRQRIDEDNAPWQPDWTTIPDSSAQTTSYTIAGLTNGTTYRFRVRAVNAVGASATARTKATPMSSNRPPTLDGPSAVSLAENSPDAVGTYTATDPDGDSLTWTLAGRDASAFELSGRDTTRTLHFEQPPDFETQPTYTVAVVVTDGSLSATVAVTVTVVNVDEPGTVALSSTQPWVGEPITATLADPDGGVSNVGWTWSSGSSTSEGLTSTLTPTPAMVGTRLQATAHYEDDHGIDKSAQSIQTEAVIGWPDSPESLSATPGDEQVTLGWTTPADNGSPITRYEYRQSADGGSTWAPDWTTIPDSKGSTTSYTLDDLTNGTEYTLEVRAVNAVGAGAATRTTATPVQPNRPPALDGPSAVSLAENSTDAVGTYTATDPNGDALTWSLTGDDARAFELDDTGTSRSLHFEQPPDFETQPTYTVAVVVTDDGSLSATVAVTVTIVNVDEPGTVVLSSTQPRVGASITATLADPDGSVSNVGWTWSAGSGTSEGLASTVTPTQDMAGTRLQATAHYEDGHGIGKSAQSVQTAAVVGRPDPVGSLSATPGDEQVTLGWTTPADNGSPITRYEYRQSADGGSTWSPDWTTIRRSDAETTRYTVERLSNGSEYTFAVRAVNAVGVGDAVSIMATPVAPNRPPMLEGPTEVSLAENSTDAVGTYTATDPDDDPLTWSLTGRDASAFRLDDTGTSRSLHFEQPPDFETQPTYTVAVVVTDDGSLSATVMVSVTVSNVDEPGTVALSTTQPRVGEPITATLADPDGGVSNVGWTWSSGAGTAEGITSTVTPTQDMVGTRLQATVAYDDGQGRGKSAESVWTEAVVGRPDPVRSLSATPGDEQVTLGWPTPADNGSPITRYEYRQSADGGNRWSPDWTPIPDSKGSTTSYTLAGLTNGTEYTFAVRAVNAVGAGEAARTTATPIDRRLTLYGPRAVSIDENSTEAVGTYSAIDPDSTPDYTTIGPDDDALTWLLTGEDARAFVLQGHGPAHTLHFEQPPDFERQPTYTVVVVLTDGGSLSATVEVTVTVVNVDEPGTVALSTTQPQVGEPITATLTDPDGGVTEVEWTWSSGATAQGLSSTLTPTQEMAGTRLQATAQYADGHGAGKSAESVWTAAVGGRPDPPGGLSATLGDGQVTLGWTTPADNGSPITHYAYRLSADWGTTWDPDWTTIPSSDAETTRFTLDDGLTIGIQHTFAVRAVNAVGAGEAARTTAIPVTVPDAVVNLEATPRSEQVVLDWSAPASDGGTLISGYESRYSSTNPATWTDAEPSWAAVPGGSSARSQTVSGLTNGTAYTFAVRAVNKVGAGAAVRVSATPAVSTPGPVRNLSATSGDKQVTLRWAVPLSDGGTAITHYQYQRGGGRWTTVAGGAAARGRTVSGLTNGTTYTFSVRAVNKAGGGPSRSITGTPVSSPSPDPDPSPDPSPDPDPCELHLSASHGRTSVSLSWSTSGDCDITGYQCRRDGGSWSNVGTSTSKTETGLPPCASYTFYVQALNGTKVEASASRSVTLKSPGTVSLTTTSPVVGKPVTAMLTDPDGGITGASWSWGSSSFTLAQSEASTAYPELSSYTPSASDVGRRLQASVSYRDNCSPDNIIDSRASSSRTAPVKAASGKPVSLQAMPDTLLAAIAAPNPFNPTTTLHIQLPVSSPVSLTIYNMAGQVVRSLWEHHELEAGYHALDWDGRDSQGQPVTSGVYLYRVQTSTQTVVHKMLLLR